MLGKSQLILDEQQVSLLIDDQISSIGKSPVFLIELTLPIE